MRRFTTRTAGDVLLSLLLVAGISAPGLAMLVRSSEGETTENRLLATCPHWSWDRAAIDAYPKAFETFFDDTFGLRSTLTHWRHLAALKVFGVSPHEKVAAGKDGRLFLQLEIEDYRGDRGFTPQDLALRMEMLQQRHDWCAAQGIRYLVVLVPNKATVYPQYLPGDVAAAPQGNNLHLLEDYAKRHSTVPVLNLTHCLVQASNRERTYPITDCHWNDYGAWVGYREIISRLRNWFPELEPLEREELKATDTSHGGDLAYMIGLFKDLPEPRTVLRPAEPNFVVAERLHEPMMFYSEISKVDDPALPRAVVFHDSFMTNQREFLSQNFELTRYLRIETGFDPTAVAQYKPDVVIQEIVERMLPNLVTNPPGLKTSPTGGPGRPDRLAAGPETLPKH